MARVDLPQSKVRAKRRKRQYIVGAIIFVLFLLVLGGSVWLSRASFLRITDIQVSGTQTVAPSAVTDFVQNSIAGHRLFLFSKNNIFLYPQTQIQHDLPAAMPVVASVRVHAINFHTIGVDIVERQPKALWCGDSVEASVSNCLLLDQSGAAYGPQNGGFVIVGQDTSSGYKKYYGVLHGSTTPQQYITPEAFTSLGALVDAIAQNQPQDAIESVAVDQNSDARVRFASGFELIFALSADGGDVYTRFILAQQSDAFKGRTIADFQYLDLRFGDRLYYKVKAQ